MPRRKRPLSALAALSQPNTGVHKQAKELAAERNLLAAEIARLQDRLGASAKFCAKARDLLTRAWFQTDWNGRRDLVKAARWLIHLETLAMAEKFLIG